MASDGDSWCLMVSDKVSVAIKTSYLKELLECDGVYGIYGKKVRDCVWQCLCESLLENTGVCFGLQLSRFLKVGV